MMGTLVRAGDGWGCRGRPLPADSSPSGPSAAGSLGVWLGALSWTAAGGEEDADGEGR